MPNVLRIQAKQAITNNNLSNNYVNKHTCKAYQRKSFNTGTHLNTELYNDFKQKVDIYDRMRIDMSNGRSC